MNETSLAGRWRTGRGVAVWLALAAAGCGGSSSSPLNGTDAGGADSSATGSDAGGEDAPSADSSTSNEASASDGSQGMDGTTDASQQADASDASDEPAPLQDAAGDAASDASASEGGADGAAEGGPDGSPEASSEGGHDAGPDADGATCTDACNAGDSECASGGVSTCAAGAGGCTQWGAAVACGGNQTCQASGNAASCTCNASVCSQAGSFCVTGTTTLDTCSTDGSGCLYVSSSMTCSTSVQNAVPACTGSACTFKCDSGYHACSGACADSSSVSSCGSSCTACVAPANGTATCNGTTCGFTCGAGYASNGSKCDAIAPQAIAPLSTKIVTTRTPKLSWVLPAGIAQAHVDVCSDRACNNVIWNQDVTGSSVAVGSALPIGTAYWRLFGVGSQGQGSVPSPTWQFAVPGKHSAALSTSWGSVHDFDGDGYADLTVNYTPVAGGSTATVYYGGASGISGSGRSTTFTSIGPRPTSLGDVNGDGFADFGVHDGSGNEVYFGSATGVPTVPSQTISSSGAAVAVGDVNGDGFADVATCISATMRVYFGSATGLAATAGVTIANPTNSNLCYNTGGWAGNSVALDGGGDVNGDGFDDIVVGASPYPSGGFVGRIYTFLGGPSGPPTTPSQAIDSPTGGATGFGGMIVIAGDLNGDGYADVGVSTQYAGHTPVAAYVYYGSSTGLPASPSVTLSNPMTGGWFGTDLGAAGDVNGDGYGDFMVGDYGNNDGYLYLGGASGLATAPAVTFVGPAGYYFGDTAGIGDVDGDGFFDVAVSGPNQNSPPGITRLYSGSATGPSATPSSTVANGAGISSLTGG